MRPQKDLLRRGTRVTHKRFSQSNGYFSTLHVLLRFCHFCCKLFLICRFPISSLLEYVCFLARKREPDIDVNVDFNIDGRTTKATQDTIVHHRSNKLAKKVS